MTYSIASAITGMILLFHAFCFAQPYSIPTAGNAYSANGAVVSFRLSAKGITEWKDNAAPPVMYFRTSSTGQIQLAVVAGCASGSAEVCFTVAGQERCISIQGNEPRRYAIGAFDVKDTGYVAVALRGKSKVGENYGEISTLEVSGDGVSGKVHFVKDEFYWGRRGPSVHLSYALPAAQDFEWFYHEITVPAGNDVVGSYFMANGFGEGYFGIQVNSPTERRVLFSVWSPFNTDDPKAIPDSMKIRLLGKGPNVVVGEFGNEGSGGQSRMVYMWHADSTYRFLTQVRPDGKGNTRYTSYFFAPEKGEWQLMASFLRPATHTWYKRPHGFLENFIPDMGAVTRKVYYSNPWARSTDGRWVPLTEARFTADATARKGARMDYAGGAAGARFFLQNCGFFAATTPVGSVFSAEGNAKPPAVDLSRLPLQ